MHSVMRCHLDKTAQDNRIHSDGTIGMAPKYLFSLRNLHYFILHISRAAPNAFYLGFKHGMPVDRLIGRELKDSRCFSASHHHLPSPARLLLGHRFSAKKRETVDDTGYVCSLPCSAIRVIDRSLSGVKFLLVDSDTLAVASEPGKFEMLAVLQFCYA